MRFPFNDSIHCYILIAFFVMTSLACGESEEATDPGESQTEGECALEYETFCEGPDCCPEDCYSLMGRIIDVENGCQLDSDQTHWCISPAIFIPGEEVTNSAALACYFDDDTGVALGTASPATGLHSTGGPLVRCDSATEEIVYSDIDPCPSTD